MKEPPKGAANPQLRRARELRCWSQEYVAQQLGTSPVNVSRWERGCTSPSPYFRQKLCELFEQSATELGLVRKDRHETLTVGVAAADADRLRARDPACLPPIAGAKQLIGRADLLHELKSRLCSSDGGIVTALYGLPGVGKTALATQLANDRDVLRHFSDGVLWAGLGQRPKALALLSAWGTAVGLGLPQASQLSDVEALMRAIRAAIGERRILLVIDDAWTLADTVIFRVGGPMCASLLTTRIPEIALRFASDGAVRVNELSEDDGLVLLARLAPQVVATERSEARKLVRSVGGLPLALTLLGEYFHVQAHSGQPRRLRAALGHMQDAEERLCLANVRMPEDSSPGMPLATPLSLRTVIALSEQGLSSEARSALHALSVFPPKPVSFTETAAVAVCEAPPEVLDELTDAGLLEGQGAGRYMLHQTIADYAHIELADHAAYRRMAAYFIQFVEDNSTNYSNLEAEASNILAALDCAYYHEMSAEAVRGICMFAPYLEARGLYQIAETHLNRAKEVALASHDDVRLASIWLHLGRLAELRGNLASAEEVYELGLAIAAKTGQQEVMSSLLAHRGEVSIARGDYQRATCYLQQGLDIAHGLGDARRVGLLLRLLGEAADCAGDYANGDELYLRALAIVRETNDHETTSALLQNLGEKAMKRGEVTLAERYLWEGLRSARTIGHLQRMSALLANLAALALRQQRFDEADQLLRESLELAERIGHPIRSITALLYMAKLDGERANLDQASAHLQAGLHMARSIGHPFLTAECLVARGEVYLKEQLMDAAAEMFQEALALTQQNAAHELNAMSLYGLARLAAMRGEYMEAERFAQESRAKLAAEGHEKAREVAQWLADMPQAAVARHTSRSS